MIRIVIAVGGVDSVDGPDLTVQVGCPITPHSGCEADSVSRISCPCGRMREKSIHKVSTENVHFSYLPHLGESIRRHPYMGGEIMGWKILDKGLLHMGCHLSTNKSHLSTIALSEQPGEKR